MDYFPERQYSNNEVKNFIVKNFIHIIFNSSIDDEQLHKIVLLIPKYKLQFSENKPEFSFCHLCKKNKTCKFQLTKEIKTCKNCRFLIYNLIEWYNFLYYHFIPNIDGFVYDDFLKKILLEDFFKYRNNFMNNKKIPDNEKIEPVIQLLPDPNPPMEYVII